MRNIVTLLTVLLMLSTSTVWALSGAPKIGTQVEVVDPDSILQTVYSKAMMLFQWLQKFSFPMCLILFIVGVFMAMLSVGNPLLKQRGYGLVVTAVLGFVIIQFAPTILAMVM